MVATGDEDGVVWIFDSNKKNVIGKLGSHQGPINCV